MLNRIKITARLLIGFGALMAIIAGLSGFSIYSAIDAGRGLNNIDQLKSNEVLSLRAERQIFEARLATWMNIATGDTSLTVKADAAFKLAYERLDQMIANTRDPKRSQAAGTLKSALADFQAQSLKLRAIGGQNGAITTGDGLRVANDTRALAIKITEINEPLTNDYREAADTLVSQTEALLDRTTIITAITGIISMVLGCFLSFVIARSVVSPIKSMTTAMASLAKGVLSTAIPATDNKDEIGEMARAVEVFKLNMAEAERLRAEQEARKQRSAEERREAMSHLASRFEANAGGIVTSVTAQATELQATAQSMASIAEETSRQSTIVAAASEQAMQNVNTVAAATEQLSASVREILQRVTESTQFARETMNEANAADHGMRALASAMDRIGEVVGLISGIAGQTNLLALNATIEAARAGDAGKGFAVVASEVKALANQTAKATQEISTQISAIQEATRGSVQSIQGIVTRIGRVSEAATAIASAVEEQGSATAEIARNVAEAAKGTGEVSSNISGLNSAAQNTGAAASEVLASASNLSQSGEALKAQVDAFLLEVRAA